MHWNAIPKTQMRGDCVASLEVWTRGIVAVYANSADCLAAYLPCRLNDITLPGG
jgi:hypothetical protein